MALPLLLKRKPNYKTLKNLSIIHFFSTSDPKGKPQTPASATEDTDTSSSSEQSRTRSQSAFSSYLNEVKASLKNQQQQSQPNSQSFELRTPTSSSFASKDSLHHKSSLKDVPLEEIRKNLSTFRRPSVGLPADSNTIPSSSTSSSPSSQQHISFEELYKRNVTGKSDDTTGKAEMTPGKVGGTMSYDQIRESLRNVVNNERRNVSGGVQNSKVVGGRDGLPKSVFWREMMEKKEGDKSAAMKTELLGMYSYGHLGQRLRELRPEEKEGDWFSLKELNERLSKLRAVEEKEAANNQFKVLRDTMVALNTIEKDGPKKRTLQSFDIHGLVRHGRTPDFMQKPPKQHLVEKFFHPDNMSSAEKLKIELVKVREDFKMSESDCGSARVQVAQLTTKIKHLSSVLHKKDKHSRKGLEEMVQRRKSLLKYLRRTDWDSYCFVISKLGLRDNPISRA